MYAIVAVLTAAHASAVVGESVFAAPRTQSSGNLLSDEFDRAGVVFSRAQSRVLLPRPSLPSNQSSLVSPTYLRHRTGSTYIPQPRTVRLLAPGSHPSIALSSYYASSSRCRGVMRLDSYLAPSEWKTSRLRVPTRRDHMTQHVKEASGSPRSQVRARRMQRSSSRNYLAGYNVDALELHKDRETFSLVLT
ncbi:hypothetical protein C8R46DRAFT_90795 [Mycena filopes]|nr:hypothetical protein C8R46DRAFT_90795 [Mycena filopes]